MRFRRWRESFQFKSGHATSWKPDDGDLGTDGAGEGKSIFAIVPGRGIFPLARIRKPARLNAGTWKSTGRRIFGRVAGKNTNAVFLGTIVTMTHTGSVLLLGLITLAASHYILPALIAPWLEVISGVLVIGFGINLLIQRRQDLIRFTARSKETNRPVLHRLY